MAASAPSSPSLPPPGTARAAQELVLFASAALSEEGASPALRGALVHGPRGSGKTALAKWLCGTLGCACEWAHCPLSAGGGPGAEERALRAVFDRALATSPSVVVVEGLDGVAPKGDDGKIGARRRLVSALCSDLDRLRGRNVFVVALSTVGPADLAPKVCTGPNRLAVHLALAPLTLEDRVDALQRCIGSISHHDDGDDEYDDDDAAADVEAIGDVAERCRGYTLRDVATLVHRAAGVTRDALLAAAAAEGGCSARRARPGSTNNTTTRGGRGAGGPKFGKWLTLEDLDEEVCTVVGATMGRRRRTVRDATLAPLLKDDELNNIKNNKSKKNNKNNNNNNKKTGKEDTNAPLAASVRPGCGAVVYGATGTGKTALVNSVAREAVAYGIAVLRVDCSAVLESTLGASERNVRACLATARSQAPCLVLFESLDLLGTPRGHDSTSEGSLDRVLGTLLMEMDGVHRATAVSFLATTTKLATLDEALLRPGRLGTRVHLAPPDAEDRLTILRAATAKMPLDPAACAALVPTAQQAPQGTTAADLQGLCQRAAMTCLRDAVDGGRQGDEMTFLITADHFRRAARRGYCEHVPTLLVPQDDASSPPPAAPVYHFF